MAFGILCIVWGSTYLAIRVGVAHLPPALLAGIRFVVAGAILLAVARAMGRPLPVRPRDWVTNAVVGLLLLALGNGMVVWAEQFVASGIAAIFVVTLSLWMALFDAIIPGSSARPTWSQAAGLAVGFAGTLMLVGTDLETLRQADWRGPLALTAAAGAWGLGSVISQRRPMASGPYINSALQMLIGGLALLLIATVRGEWGGWQWTTPGVLALGYLIVFGSLVGFTAYVYVLRHMSATVTGTYAYANTVVAVLLGWLLLGEPLTGRMVLSMAVIIGAVLWVRRTPNGPRPRVRPVSTLQPACAATVRNTT